MVRKIFKNQSLLIFLIFALGFFLRTYSLGEVPVSMHRDEAFLTYNAYSILQTGKDISGNLLPIHLESFLFSPGGYSYFSIPPIALFGLSEFSARLAAALSGSLTVVLIYMISLELFRNKSNKNAISLFSAFFLATMPWHISLSRVAAEGTLVVFFITLGIFSYLRYLQGNKIMLVLFSFVSFGINLFIYQAPRAFLPLFIPFLAITLSSLRKFAVDKVQITLYLLLIIMPVIFILLSPNLSTRIQNLNIFQHPETKILIREQLVNDTVQGVPQVIARTFHNKVSGYSLLFLNNYFSHLSYDFLFSDKGFPDRFRIPNMGLLYIYQLPLLIIAFFMLTNKNPRISLFLFGWIGISIFGSALTFDDIPNQQRTLTAAPALAILSGVGALEVLSWARQKKYKLVTIGLFSLIILFSFFHFLIQYFVQGKVYRTWYRQDGYKQLVREINELLPSYDKAVITSRETGSTILFLFYLKYDPKNFQEETKDLNTKESDHISFYKYELTDEECPLRIDAKSKKLTGRKNILYVNSSLCNKEIEGAILISEVYRSGGSGVYRIYKVE